MAKVIENKSGFKLKKGTIIPIPGTSKVYSEHNLTDEIAAELLRQNPNRKVLFTSIPEDFDFKVKSETPKGKKSETPKVDEIEVVAEEVKVDESEVENPKQ